MRRNVVVVGSIASEVSCSHKGRGEGNTCFIRKSMLNKVHIPCWAAYIKQLREVDEKEPTHVG